MKKISLLLLITLSFYSTLFDDAISQKVISVKELNDVRDNLNQSSKSLSTERSVEIVYEKTYNGEDASGDLKVFKIQNFDIDNSGNIYMSDFFDMKIAVFDSNAGFIRHIGGKGRGPGEFLIISDIAKLPDGRLIALDTKNFRTSYFDSQGEYITSHRWNKYRFDLYLANNSIYLGKGASGGGKPSKVKAFSHSGNILYSLFDFNDYETYRSENITTVVPFSPRSIVVGDVINSILYHFSGTEYKIDIYDIKGTLVRSIDKKYSRLPISNKFRTDFYNDLIMESPEAKNAIEVMKSEVDWFDYFPAISDMIVDDEGNLWVETFEIKKVDGKDLLGFDIYNSAGEFITRTWFDLQLGERRVIKNGKLYTLFNDKLTAEVTIKRYNIVRSN